VTGNLDTAPPPPAVDSEAQADFLLGHYVAMSSDARMIFSAKLTAWQIGEVFLLDHAKLDAWNRSAPNA
jgi:hypothetical protein